MTAAAVLTVAGWALGLAALVAAVAVHRGQGRRLALVAEAAHELRGPLCAARLGLHALESAGEPVAHRAAAVELELRRAGLALEDLAAAPRGRRTGERLEILEVGDVLAGGTIGWSALVQAQGARLRVAPSGVPALVRGDRVRLAQALSNLVVNAAEHGAGEVHVSATVSRARVRIEVADDGPGLPAALGLLVAAGRGAREARGHGLAVAARVAERHGGRLTADPAARGARLVLDLPLARPHAVRKPSGTSGTRSSVASGRTALLP